MLYYVHELPMDDFDKSCIVQAIRRTHERDANDGRPMEGGFFWFDHVIQAQQFISEAEWLDFKSKQNASTPPR